MKREKFQQITTPVVDVFMSIEEQILINIAKRIKRHNSLLNENNITSWELEQLQELGALRQDNLKTIAQYSGIAIDEVEQMLKEAGYAPANEMEATIAAGVAAGVLLQPPSVDASPALEAIMSQYLESAEDSFNLIGSTMLNQSNQAYTDILNRTVGKVLSGSVTPQEALRDTISEWADNGVPALVDKKGREWSPESYVSLVTKSMSNNIANDMQDARMREAGIDHIEVSSHLGARTRCAPFQGKVYNISGTDSRYPAFSTTSYGELAGLFGINCGHVKYPFIPGVSKQRYPTYDDEKNKRAYENSQKQRYLERRIRKAKREQRMFEAMEDETGVAQAKAKVRERQADMRAFIGKTNRKRRRGREQIY